MFDFLEKLAALRYLRFTDDYYLLGDDKLLFYFSNHLAEEYRTFITLFGLDYGAAQFLVGKKAGIQFVESHGKKLGKSFEEVIEVSEKVLHNLGWGRFATWKADQARSLLLINADLSTVADDIKLQHGPQKYPADFLLSGLFAGAVEAFCATKVYGIELDCRVQENVQTCQFIAATEDEITRYVKEFAPRSASYAQDFIARTKKLESKA